MENIAGRIELFHNIYLACLGGMILFFALSIFLYFRLDIKSVIGFFTGKQAKREISKIEEADFGKRASAKNLTSSMKTEKISHGIDTGHIKKGENLPLTAMTSKLEENDMGATTVLSAFDGGETTLLQPENLAFYLEQEILLIHTNEIIE